MTKKAGKKAGTGAPPAAAGVAPPGVLAGGQLVVDLRGRALSADDFWAAMVAACALPAWFGCNLDAWRDTLVRGGISRVLDAQPLVVRVDAAGIFAPGDRYGRVIAEIFEEAAESGARLEVALPNRAARRQAG